MRRRWRRHLGKYSSLRHMLADHQDPKVFALSCSDSRVNLHEIFDMDEPGSIFESKNLAGVFTPDAQAALVYAMLHLDPQFVILLHHLGCGAYQSLDSDSEPEIRRHMLESGGFHSKMRVEAYLSEKRIKLPKKYIMQLIVEEGARYQSDSIISFLKLDYKKSYEKVRDGMVIVIPLLYDIESGKVYKVPKSLEGSQDMVREEF